VLNYEQEIICWKLGEAFEQLRVTKVNICLKTFLDS